GLETMGRGGGVAGTPADVGDSRGAGLAVTDAKVASARLVHVWADGAYRGFIDFALALLAMTVEIVCRRDGAVGFEVQHRRWVVERTFGWLTRWRRLNRNYEHTLASSRAVVQVALIGLMTGRFAKTNRR